MRYSHANEEAMRKHLGQAFGTGTKRPPITIRRPKWKRPAKPVARAG